MSTEFRKFVLTPTSAAAVLLLGMDADTMLAEVVALLDLISEACDVVRGDAERGSRDPEVWGTLGLLEDAPS
jgi:hypothetical protein